VLFPNLRPRYCNIDFCALERGKTQAGPVRLYIEEKGVIMISGAKQGIFRKVVQMAWDTHCQSENANIGTKYDHAWYQTELVTHFGIFSSKQIAANDEMLFEQICLHFATVSVDMLQITYWSAAV